MPLMFSIQQWGEPAIAAHYAKGDAEITDFNKYTRTHLTKSINRY